MRKLLLFVSSLFIAVALMAQYNVTFQVDLNELPDFNAETTDVYIAGDFLGWEQPGSNTDYMMTPNATDPLIYEFVYEFAAGENVAAFKFFLIYDATPSWDNGEWTGDPNRVAVFIGETTVKYTWADKPNLVTFNVDMENATEFDPVTDEIFIAGNLANGWAQPGTVQYYKLTPPAKELLYSITLQVYTSDDVQYKYFRVIDGVPSWDNGEWTGDPNRMVAVASDTIFNDIWGTTGIIDNNIDAIRSLFPNPCQSYLNVTLNNDINQVNSIEIHNILGELVYTLENLSMQKEIRLSTSDLTNGLYFLTIRNNQGYQVAKFVKE
jgi:hypothetical protein